MKKELKREIKEDEFASWLEKVIIWGASHRDELRIGVGVVVVLLAAFGALTYFQSHRTAEAERAFRDALDAFEAPVASEIPTGADRPAGQVFATAEDKYKTAAAGFEGVTRRYGSSHIATRAKYYAALARIELEQYAEAEKALRELVAPGPDLLVPDLARVALGRDGPAAQGLPERPRARAAAGCAGRPGGAAAIGRGAAVPDGPSR